jgi:hypothetical protein
MISSVLRAVASDAFLPLTKKSFKGLAGFDPVSQVRSSRAKTKPGGVLGSTRSVFAAACDWGRLAPSSPRTQAAALGGAKCKAEDTGMRSAPGVIQACGVAGTDLHSSAIHASEDGARRRFRTRLSTQRVRLARGGPSGARTQGGQIAVALFGRLRTPHRAARGAAFTLSAATRRARGVESRVLLAARTESGSTDRTQAASCKGHRAARAHHNRRAVR